MELIHNATQILGALLAIAILYVAPKVAKWITIDGQKMETEELIAIILQFVQAAEQLLKEKDPTGEQRYQYVKEHLEELGYNVTEYVASLIEGAVFQVNKGGGEL